jgi:hypothetical protein
LVYRWHALVELVLLLQLESEEPLIPVHDSGLKFDWDIVSYDLEEAIAETTISYFFYEVRLCCSITAKKL